MNWQTLFNPFSIYTEKQLVISGIFLTITGSVIGYLCNSTFNGVLDMHLIDNTKLSIVFLENTINISTLTILLFGLGKYLNNKTRIIDILNTSFWYRLPLYAVSALSFFLIPSDLNKRVAENINQPEKILSQPMDMVLAILFGLISLLCITYAVVLLVYGFKTASNIKKSQHWVAFGLAILIAEAISHVLIKQFA
ncbi:hypothetical protein NAT51_10745 [Flavobacterium amniphilum]|uniref:hypothetical protein n=1 Tax=Flavobacterium amniphilum TaxID=1834035 RepID=UPI00202A3F2D|nr:hypothetical protein [Flavobacterium amniphilum]MCL9806004.1 hypothetical protein [Flavobacterium amniphilum]